MNEISTTMTFEWMPGDSLDVNLELIRRDLSLSELVVSKTFQPIAGGEALEMANANLRVMTDSLNSITLIPLNEKGEDIAVNLIYYFSMHSESFKSICLHAIYPIFTEVK